MAAILHQEVVMSLKLSLFTAGTIAIVAIVLSAVVVLRKAAPPSQTAQHDHSAVQHEPPANASPVEADARPEADPSAQGVIAAQSQGRLFLLTPQGDLLADPAPFTQPTGLSRDDAWLAMTDCKENGCRLVLGAQGATWDLDQLTVQLSAPFLSGEWAPQAAVFAALDTAGNLYFVEPRTRSARLVKPNVTAYAWAAGDRLVFATNEVETAKLWRATTSGAWSELARTKAPVMQLFPSDDSLNFAFAQDDTAGWRLAAVNADDGRLRDFGNLGGDSSHAKAPAFAIAWSPDASHLAVGPVVEPFTLFVVQTGAGVSPSTYSLEKGYAGELKWSPDGSRLAISTYAPNRVWHEVFVLGMDTLAAGPRFLLDGCEIAWSPDGQFVAVKREASRAQALAAIRVDTGDYWHVHDLPNLVPVAWGADRDAATTEAQTPVRRSAQLGK
jgi:hypothetical protein